MTLPDVPSEHCPADSGGNTRIWSFTMAPQGQEYLAERFEEVLVRNLGEVGRFLMAQQLKALGRDRATFTEADVERFMDGLKSDFERVIGYGVNQLEDDLKKCLTEGD